MSNYKYFTVAIDGAAGSGISTTARKLCHKFNYIHVDTGLHYRSVALFFKNNYISADAVEDYLSSSNLSLSSVQEGSNFFLLINDQRFSFTDLRSKKLNEEVSYYARLPKIRSLLLAYQQNLPSLGHSSGFSGMVMDGRDIGSVVLPSADLKIFLHADLSVRESRRMVDGENDFISGRDHIDTNRKTAPLVCPDDAIPIDTGTLPIDDVVDLISQKILQAR